MTDLVDAQLDLSQLAAKRRDAAEFHFLTLPASWQECDLKKAECLQTFWHQSSVHIPMITGIDKAHGHPERTSNASSGLSTSPYLGGLTE